MKFLFKRKLGRNKKHKVIELFIKHTIYVSQSSEITKETCTKESKVDIVFVIQPLSCSPARLTLFCICNNRKISQVYLKEDRKSLNLEINLNMLMKHQDILL